MNKITTFVLNYGYQHRPKKKVLYTTAKELIMQPDFIFVTKFTFTSILTLSIYCPGNAFIELRVQEKVYLM